MLKCTHIVLLVILATWSEVAGYLQPRVAAPAGIFLGKETESGRQKKKIYSFTGIPYARPPVDGLRFMSPQPLPRMTEEFDATKEPPECLQWDHLRMRGVVGEEDCLYLNVFTGHYMGLTASLNTAPTVVFLHAGSWLAGGAANDYFTPDYLIENDVCVVTLNHRLGSLGFLSMEDQDAPGNYGMRDIVMALDFVKTNLWHFGCMNDSITVMGTGAGGTTAHMLTLSPTARGDSLKKDDQHVLVTGAISHSGTAYSPHAISLDAKTQALRLGGLLGCHQDTSTELLNCLRLIDPKVLVGETAGLFLWDEEPLPFGPVIDPWMGEDSFLPDAPHHLIRKGLMLQVPWIAGTNRDDGAFRVQDILSDSTLVDQLNQKWNKYGPILLHLTKHSCKDPVEMSKLIRNFYMKGKPFGDATANSFVEMMTDRFFTYPTERAMKDHCRHFKRQRDLCYRYVLDHCGRKSFLDILHSTVGGHESRNVFGLSNPRFQNTRNAHGWGVSFMDELLFLFPSPKLKLLYKQEMDTEDSAAGISTAMILLWTNFIKGGDPTPHIEGFPDDYSPWNMWWDPYYSGYDYYFRINPEFETLETRYRNEQMQFWDSLPLFENTDHNVLRDEL